MTAYLYKSDRMIRIYISFLLVINDFGFQGSMGIRMLSTPDKKGLYVISKDGIFEVSFNTASFTFKKTILNAKVARHIWPIAMYVGQEYANCS